jgi:hypothetical protein
MKSFTKPTNLDGSKLIQELQTAGILVNPNGLGHKCPTEDCNGLLWLDIAAKDENAAATVVAAHNG